MMPSGGEKIPYPYEALNAGHHPTTWLTEFLDYFVTLCEPGLVYLVCERMLEMQE